MARSIDRSTPSLDLAPWIWSAPPGGCSTLINGNGTVISSSAMAAGFGHSIDHTAPLGLHAPSHTSLALPPSRASRRRFEASEGRSQELGGSPAQAFVVGELVLFTPSFTSNREPFVRSVEPLNHLFSKRPPAMTEASVTRSQKSQTSQSCLDTNVHTTSSDPNKDPVWGLTRLGFRPVEFGVWTQPVSRLFGVTGHREYPRVLDRMKERPGPHPCASDWLRRHILGYIGVMCLFFPGSMP